MVDSKEQEAAWHTLPPEALCAELDTDPAFGLTDEEARRRLLAHGPNELPAARADLSARGVSQAVCRHDRVGSLSERQSSPGCFRNGSMRRPSRPSSCLMPCWDSFRNIRRERSLAALKTLSVPTARVVRGGGDHGIPARDQTNRSRFTTAMNRPFAISSCTALQDD